MTGDERYPLYDPRLEHDACGVGFVAATRADQRHRVLPLALAGLSALGHRGAFAADGESSDGAGVLLPLERPLLNLLAPGLEGRPGVVSLFLPADPEAAAQARAIVEKALAAQGLRSIGQREVPVDPDALGSASRASLPAMLQVFVGSGNGSLGNGGLDRHLLLARRRMEADTLEAGIVDFAVASASSRTVVYKGLVAGSRVGAFYPDLRADVAISHAVYHQRYATNTHPTWALAQPFRLLAHNGEVNTVRGGRELLRGRRARLGGPLADALAGSGPLTHPGGSDSLSLDEALDLLVASGWRLDAALLLAIVEAPELRLERLAELDAFRARTRGLMAPWDGPAALCFSDGRRVGAILDRNGLRPLAVTVSRDGMVVASSEGGSVPIERGRHAGAPASRARRDVPRRHGARGDPRRRGGQAQRCRIRRRRLRIDHDDRGAARRARPDDPLARAVGGWRRRRAPASRHQDDGPRGPRAAVVDG